MSAIIPASPYCGENRGPGKDVYGELDPTPGIRDLDPVSQGDISIHVRNALNTDRKFQASVRVALCQLLP